MKSVLVKLIVQVSKNGNALLPLYLRYVKLIHAVKVAQILSFVAKMACVVMTIMYLLVMQLPIIPMSVDVFVPITSQVCLNIAIT